MRNRPKFFFLILYFYYLVIVIVIAIAKAIVIAIARNPLVKCKGFREIMQVACQGNEGKAERVGFSLPHPLEDGQSSKLSLKSPGGPKRIAGAKPIKRIFMDWSNFSPVTNVTVFKDPLVSELEFQGVATPSVSKTELMLNLKVIKQFKGLASSCNNKEELKTPIYTQGLTLF